MPGDVEIGLNALRCLRVDRQGIAPATLAGQPQRVEATVLVQVAHGQGGDLRPA